MEKATCESTQMIVCGECGQGYLGDVYDECQNCAAFEKFHCENCSEELDADNADEFVKDDERYCPDCYNDLFFMCERCEETSSVDDATSVRTSSAWRHRTAVWCEGCAENDAFQCNDCGDVFSDSDDYGFYCGSCWEDNFSYCERCEESYRNDDGCPNGCGSGEDICEYLAGSYSDDAAEDIGFLGADESDETAIFYGCEIELEYSGSDAPDDAESMKATWNNHVVFKGDGSLNNGIELNTAPATFDYHKDFNYPRAFKVTRNASFAAESTCGLHIHVSRKPLSRDIQMKLASFIYDGGNNAFLNKIARRSASGYCSRSLSPESAFAGRDKYLALNFQNRHTIEFRLFDGVDNAENFYASLEFVDALIHFVKDTPLSELSYINFAQWLTAETNDVSPRNERYANLVKAMKYHKFIESDKTKVSLVRLSNWATAPNGEFYHLAVAAYSPVSASVCGD